MSTKCNYFLQTSTKLRFMVPILILVTLEKLPKSLCLVNSSDGLYKFTENETLRNTRLRIAP